MESLVVTLETAKRLKAAGFPQETLYWMRWHKPNGATDIRPRSFQQYENTVFKASNPPEIQERFEHENEFFAAPTAQEIADQLPDHSVVAGRTHSDGPRIYRIVAGADVRDGVGPDCSTLAEALAALWLKLHEAKR